MWYKLFKNTELRKFIGKIIAPNRCYRFGAVIEKGMTDKQFQKILDTLTDAHRNYLDLLRLAEDEIIRRYSVHPSDIDNDQWIDSYHQSVGHMTIKELDESMKLHMK